MDKASFVQHFAIRFAHEPDKISDVIDRAERIAVVLTARGYGFGTPVGGQPPGRREGDDCRREGTAPTGTAPTGGSWDGLPPAKPLTVGYHPAYAPAQKTKPEPTRQDMLQDLAHWEKLSKAVPGNEDIRGILWQARLNAGLDVDEPEDEAEPVPTPDHSTEEAQT